MCFLQLLWNREDHSDETDHFGIEEGNDQTLFKNAVIIRKNIRSTWIATSEKLSPAQETPILLDPFSEEECRPYRDKGLTAVFSFSVAGIHTKKRWSIKKVFLDIRRTKKSFFLVLLHDVSSYECVRKFPAFKELPYEVTGKKSLPLFNRPYYFSIVTDSSLLHKSVRFSQFTLLIIPKWNAFPLSHQKNQLWILWNTYLNKQ